MPTNCKPATPVVVVPSAAQWPICCWLPNETFGASIVLPQPTAASKTKPPALAVQARQRSSVLIRRIRIERSSMLGPSTQGVFFAWGKRTLC
jgi:hypothetical protein